MKTKKLLALILALALSACLLAGCSSDSGDADTTPDNTVTQNTDDQNEQEDTNPAPAESVELIVFAAASMDGYLQDICDAYTAENPNVTFTYNFDSSGTLKTQIEEGAPCDIFISAGQKQVDQLDIEADPSVNTDGLDFIQSDSRFDLLENKVALAVPEGNPANITSYDDLAAGLKDGTITLAMGNSDVPVGQYTQKILAYYELAEEDLAASGSVTYGSNVREVATFVDEATVDCGVIYQTDATAYGLTVVDTATAEMCGQVIYPAAALKESANLDTALDFLEFLKGDTAGALLEAGGFTPLG